MRDQQPFFTEFLLTDVSIWLVLFATLVTCAAYAPAEIGPKADALQPAPPGIKPEWYFLWMYQVLKYVPERAGVVGLTVGAVGLLALPLLDRRASQQRCNSAMTALYLVVMAAIALLQIGAWASPSVQHSQPPLLADTYRPASNTVWLVLLWVVVVFLVYYLQQLRRHNRRLRRLVAAGAAREPG